MLPILPIVSVVGFIVYEQLLWFLLTKLPNSENLCGQASPNIAKITVRSCCHTPSDCHRHLLSLSIRTLSGSQLLHSWGGLGLAASYLNNIHLLYMIGSFVVCWSKNSVLFSYSMDINTQRLNNVHKTIQRITIKLVQSKSQMPARVGKCAGQL